MITSFEVGAVFKIVNEASPALSRILKQVRELNAAIDKARANLAEITKGVGSGMGLTTAIGETDKLAASWKNVAKSAGEARAAMSGASGAVRLPPPGGASTASAVRGRQAARAGGSYGGAHFGGPGVAIPGGGHVNFSGGAAAAAGLVGYGAYEAAQMEDTVFQMMYHAGLPYNDASRARLRGILQQSMRTSGFGLHDIGEAATQEIRMFQGTDSGGSAAGLDVLPEMLRAATTEARLKGGNPKEAMQALIGLAHMTKQYDPASIKALAKDFAFLSIANPSSLNSMERAAGYAVPLLQSGLEIDPMQTLLLGTALTRAGATNTKSGTWLREMAMRAMPGTSLMSKMAFKKHEEALKAFGLVDDNDNPTWFTDGKPDLMKMLKIGHEHASQIPLTKRAAYERALFGAQGGGGFALLADDAVYSQVKSLDEMRKSPEWDNRYNTFTNAYMDNSTVQQTRTAFQDFNITMMDIGKTVLPSVNEALKNFKAILEGIRDILPKGTINGTVGGAALTGALGGAAVGSIVPGVGTVAGAAAGGVLGAGVGVLQSYSSANGAKQDPAESAAFAKALREQGGTGAAPKAQLAPIKLDLNIDGRTLASTISQLLTDALQWSTTAPASDGLGIYNGGGE